MILITGANGQLGQAMSSLLEGQEKAYQAFGRRELDITNLETVREAVKGLKPKLVVNCAAYNDVDGAESHWKEALNINGLGVRNLAVTCGEKKIPLACVGTDFVFDGKSDRPYTIADEPHPINSYGRSKLLGEQYLFSLTDRYFLVRTSCVFGRGKSNFPGRVLAWAADRNVLQIVNDQISSPTLAKDLAEAILAIVRTQAYGIYHFHNAGECSRFDWARYVLSKTGWKGRLDPVASDHFATAAKRPAYSVLDMYPVSDMGVSIRCWEEATEAWLEDIS